ncbi:IPT/TIG domain-containing protein, partial [Streptomyces sp. NPDC059744]|uniref:IPT/TIG domain-containing protein n=1 Tax=Streptomyces sp. NPDC059744 TaxID=3346929 RepID=UPI0036487A98
PRSPPAAGRGPPRRGGAGPPRPPGGPRRPPRRGPRPPPGGGPPTGGTTVTVAGTGLTSTSQVTFDGNPAPFLVLSDTAVSAVTPPGAAGAVDVVVTNDAGSATAVDGYTYIAEPDI